MIVVDTSALIAVIVREPPAPACKQALEASRDIRISAGTLAEALIVAGRRGYAGEMSKLIDSLNLDSVPVTAASAQRMAGAYSRWGKGIAPAGLNLGDCFAYELAKSSNRPLLFVGDDFSKTDIQSVL